MSLSDKRVIEKLSKEFVVGWSNIKDYRYAGRSGTYQPTDAAALTTNGAGSSNIQFLFMDPDRRVLSCLPGYWEADVLLEEMNLSKKLMEIAQSGLETNDRDDTFMLAHLNQAVKIADTAQKNSRLQGFDEKAEARKEDSRFRRENNTFKTVDQVVHEKMAELPFVKLEQFDIATFVAYGTKFYDKMIPGEYGKKQKRPPMGEKEKPTSRPKRERPTSRPRS